MAEKQGLENPKGIVPPRLKPEEKEHFRKIDEEVASGRRRQSSVDDLEWVYHHLDDDEATALDAPSRGAWTRLFHGRFNRVNFFSSTWPGALKEIVKRKAPVSGQQNIETSPKSHEEITAMIRWAVEESKKTVV